MARRLAIFGEPGRFFIAWVDLEGGISGPCLSENDHVDGNGIHDPEHEVAIAGAWKAGVEEVDDAKLLTWITKKSATEALRSARLSVRSLRSVIAGKGSLLTKLRCDRKRSELGIAKRAVALQGWSPLPGMRCYVAKFFGQEKHAFIVSENASLLSSERSQDYLPDLRYPSTLGWLEALVIERWRSVAKFCPPLTHVEFMDGEWWLMVPGFDAYPLDVDDIDWKHEALVVALEIQTSVLNPK